MAKVHGESKLTFLESTSIIIGHGVGSGILSVPFLASRNNWHDIIWICSSGLLHESFTAFYDCGTVFE